MPFNKPGEDVAKSAVLNVQNATTKIKELIIESVSTGRNKEQTFEDVKRIIAKCIKNISSVNEKEKTMNALWSLAQKHYYDFSKAIAILSTNAYNKAVFNKLINAPYNYNADGDIKTVIDKFRNKLDAEHKNIAPIIEDYQKKVRSLIRTMSAEPPRIVEYTNRNGKRISYTMSLRNRAEMKVRYEANMEELNNYIAEGINLVWISTHPNCSPRCKDYQGKLYSLKNERGTINGIRYEPIDIALRGPLGDGNGCISGYNCRHRLVPYDTKSRPPNDFTEAEIQREYEIDKKQRNFENNIRQLKVNEKMLRANGDTEAAKILRKKWRILTKEYEIYCLENKRPISLWRCVVSDEEKEYYDTNLTDNEKDSRIKESKKYAEEIVELESDRKELKEYLQANEKRTQMNVGSQNKHIPTSKGYLKDKSPLTVSIDEIKVLVEDKFTTGIPKIRTSRRGERQYTEILQFDKYVGFVNDIPTKKVRMHYGNKGYHIVPYLKNTEKGDKDD